MKRLLIFVFIIGVFFLLNINVAIATELVYTPINPSFGGSPLNGQWLLNSADAQNKFKEETTTSQTSTMQSFEDQLTRRILSQIAGKIVDMAFGEEDLQSGHYVVGDYIIDVDTTSGDAINVVITDPATGNTTTIVIPYY